VIRLVLVLSLDDTLLANADAALRFWEQWQVHRAEHAGTLLVFNTRRRVFEVLERVEQCLVPPPDYVIGALGTELYDARAKVHIGYFAERIAEDWRGAAVTSVLKHVPGIRAGAATCQSALRTSWEFEDASADEIAAIEDTLALAGLRARVVYTRGRFLDVVPTRAGKREALEWLLDQCGAASSSTIVVASSAADIESLDLPGVRGIALPCEDLDGLAGSGGQVVRVSRAGGDGVIDGLRHFGVLP
jgi:hydroxymethylpyrimidine pyrophosphatase-like HAD family hydrolase